MDWAALRPAPKAKITVAAPRWVEVGAGDYEAFFCGDLSVNSICASCMVRI